MGHGGTKAGGEGCELTLPPPGTSAGGGQWGGDRKTGGGHVPSCSCNALVVCRPRYVQG